MRRLTGSTIIGVATGLGLALTPIVWANATRADPHPIHLAFVALSCSPSLVGAGSERPAQARDRLRPARRDTPGCGGIRAGVHAARGTLRLATASADAIGPSSRRPPADHRGGPVRARRRQPLPDPAPHPAGRAVRPRRGAGHLAPAPVRAHVRRRARCNGRARVPGAAAPRPGRSAGAAGLRATRRRGTGSGTSRSPSSSAARSAIRFADLPSKVNRPRASSARCQLGLLALRSRPAFSSPRSLRAAVRPADRAGARHHGAVRPASYVNADIERYYLGPVALGLDVARDPRRPDRPPCRRPVAVAEAWRPRAARSSAPGRPSPAGSEARVGARRGRSSARSSCCRPSPASTPRRSRGGSIVATRGAQAGWTTACRCSRRTPCVVSWWSTSTPLWYAQKVEGLRPDIDIDRRPDDARPRTSGGRHDVIDRYLGTAAGLRDPARLASDTDSSSRASFEHDRRRNWQATLPCARSSGDWRRPGDRAVDDGAFADGERVGRPAVATAELCRTSSRPTTRRPTSRAWWQRRSRRCRPSPTSSRSSSSTTARGTRHRPSPTRWRRRIRRCAPSTTRRTSATAAALRSGFAGRRGSTLLAFTDGDRQFKVADLGRLIGAARGAGSARRGRRLPDQARRPARPDRLRARSTGSPTGSSSGSRCATSTAPASSSDARRSRACRVESGGAFFSAELLIKLRAGGPRDRRGRRARTTREPPASPTGAKPQVVCARASATSGLCASAHVGRTPERRVGRRRHRRSAGGTLLPAARLSAARRRRLIPLERVDEVPEHARARWVGRRGATDLVRAGVVDAAGRRIRRR